MFLTYGRDEHSNLVHIAKAESGNACGLFCPFCRAPLTARKGDIVGHHFAHQFDTCRPSYTADLPSYEGYFIYGLTEAQRRALHQIIQDQEGRPFYADNLNAGVRRALASKGFLRVVAIPPHRPDDRYVRPLAYITAKSRAFAGQLSLAEYARFMRSEFEQARVRLEQQHDAESQVAREMLALEMERITQTSLYFLEIDTGQQTLHKIGLTARPISERMSEIEAFLRSHLGVQAIKPLYVLARVPYVEAYFLAKYAAYQRPIHRATEYFDFGADLKPVLAELSQLETADLEPPAWPAGSRPRLRARFERYDQKFNEFKGWYDPLVLLIDLVDLTSGEQVAEYQFFTLGKSFIDLGELQRGDVVEFNATIEGGQVKRPTRLSVK